MSEFLSFKEKSASILIVINQVCYLECQSNSNYVNNPQDNIDQIPSFEKRNDFKIKYIADFTHIVITPDYTVISSNYCKKKEWNLLFLFQPKAVFEEIYWLKFIKPEGWSIHPGVPVYSEQKYDIPIYHVFWVRFV